MKRRARVGLMMRCKQGKMELGNGGQRGNAKARGKGAEIAGV